MDSRPDAASVLTPATDGRRTRQRDVRLGTAWALAGVGLAVAAVLLARDHPAFGGRDRMLDLGPTTVAVLDTVSIAGRTVRAQFDGVVEGTDGDRTLWLAQRGQAFPVILDDSADVRVEHRLIVVGRLRGADGRRWLDADAWTVVHGRAAVLPTDSVRFAPAGDRSDSTADRSGAPR